MNYAEIKKCDVANEPDVRVSLFASVCTHHCKGCFNPETWDFNYGSPFTYDTEEEIIKYIESEYIKGLTFLGGEPLEHCNQQGLLPLLRKVKQIYPEKDIWCFTGYDFEKDVTGRMFSEWEETREMLSYIDVIVDGEFMADKKDLNLVFKGSSNQRIIMVQESMACKGIVYWEEG